MVATTDPYMCAVPHAAEVHAPALLALLSLFRAHACAFVQVGSACSSARTCGGVAPDGPRNASFMGGRVRLDCGDGVAIVLPAMPGLQP